MLLLFGGHWMVYYSLMSVFSGKLEVKEFFHKIVNCQMALHCVLYLCIKPMCMFISPFESVITFDDLWNHVRTYS